MYVPEVEIFEQTDGTWSYRCTCGARGHNHQTTSDAVARAISHMARIHPEGAIAHMAETNDKEKKMKAITDHYKDLFVGEDAAYHPGENPIDFVRNLGIEYTEEESEKLGEQLTTAAAAMLIATKLKGIPLNETLAAIVEGTFNAGLAVGILYARDQIAYSVPDVPKEDLL